MPERLEKLRAIVTELERELASLPSLDADSRQVLEQATREIQSALNHRDTSNLRPDSLMERLSGAEQDFEISHPTLSRIVLRMVDILGQMGI